MTGDAMLDQTQSSDHSPRNGPDRRTHGLKSFWNSLHMRRRKGMRRDKDEMISHYVDVHDQTTIWTTIAIIVLSCTDSFLTLTLLQQGLAYEANPVMRALIETDTTLFVAGKAAVTIFCLLFLVAHKNFWLFNNRLRTKTILFSILVGYIVLINYELVLLNM